MKVSVIVPCYNEIDFIRPCLESIYEACLEFGEGFEIIVSDGGSDDGTMDELNELRVEIKELLLLNNSKKKQVYALNQMLGDASGEYIVRCDVHAIYDRLYVRRLIDFLESNPDVGNVGAQVNTCSLKDGLVEQAISVCLSSKFGVGSSHRSTYSDDVVDCDTVLFGAWRASVFKNIGKFDENFIRGQDLEHNLRILKSGLRVVQIPYLGVTYFTRNSYRQLFNMMKQYASVKPMILLKGLELGSYRSFAPFIMYLTFLLFGLISSKLLLTSCCVYLGMAAYFSAKSDLKGWGGKFLIVIGFVVQHMGHAYGMLLGFYYGIRNRNINWEVTR